MAKTEIKEWTLMFYFASDNALAPGIVSQLKALKNAGYHSDANVIAHFDPQTEGTPTHIFDVNLVEKITDPDGKDVGFTGNDPYIRNLMRDKLWRNDQVDRNKRPIKERIKASLGANGSAYTPPEPPHFKINKDSKHPRKEHEIDPATSLSGFLEFCREKYPARHYMLFILGHGVVVGNDMFLFDEHAAKQSVTLTELGKMLNEFKDKIERDASFELISLHSCSMSSAEVAYELQGTANYLLASQGPAFVGSWPYRQILLRIFNDLERHGKDLTAEQIKEMITKIFYYCLHNSSDFVLAGYSFDLCLCDLRKVGDLKKPLKALSEALTAGLKDTLLTDLILLAHWRSQSFWQESYTDLYDFCFCLRKQCESFSTAGQMSKEMEDIYKTSGLLIDVLTKEAEADDGLRGNDDRIIVRAEYAGPAYQFSHGLSVFFPWAEPSSDGAIPIWSNPSAPTPIVGQYEQYKFEETSWRNFLVGYFKETMRETRKTEANAEAKKQGLPPSRQSAAKDLLEDMTSLLYNREGPLSQDNALEPGKPGPADPTGDDCTCHPIKNHPRDIRASRERGREASPELVPISQTFFSDF